MKRLKVFSPDPGSRAANGWPAIDVVIVDGRAPRSVVSLETIHRERHDFYTYPATSYLTHWTARHMTTIQRWINWQDIAGLPLPVGHHGREF